MIAPPIEVLPHRPPFLLLDEVVSHDGESASGLWRPDPDDPLWDGHFPSRPTLPGVLMVESLAQLGAYAVLASPSVGSRRLPLFGGIDRARFRRPVVPGETLELSVTLGRRSARAGRGSGTVTVDGEVAATAELLFVLVDA